MIVGTQGILTERSGLRTPACLPQGYSFHPGEGGLFLGSYTVHTERNPQCDLLIVSFYLTQSKTFEVYFLDSLRGEEAVASSTESE